MRFTAYALRGSTMDRHAHSSGRLESAAFATGPADRPVTHVGAQHPEIGFFALAYGLAGEDPQTGALAARLVASDLGAQAVQAGGFADSEALAAAVQQAEARMRRHLGDGRHVCTVTLAALQLRDSKAIVAHVGDLRVYRVHRGQSAALTRDHTLERVVREGDGWLQPDERRELKTHQRDRWDRAPYKIVVCRALVAMPGRSDARPTPVETTVHDAAPGDLFLLAQASVGDEWQNAASGDPLRETEPGALPQALVMRALTGLPQELDLKAAARGGRALLRPFVPQLAALAVRVRG